MKHLKTFALLFLIVGMVAAPVLAANPHFIRANADGPDDQGNLAVSFKIAGLGDAVSTTVTVNAYATAVYACRNNGGNFPADPKKEEVAGPVSASGLFTSGKNGQINGLLTIAPPATTLDCPNGQKNVLVSVHYANVSVSEFFAGTENIAGVFLRIFFVI